MSLCLIIYSNGEEAFQAVKKANPEKLRMGLTWKGIVSATIPVMASRLGLQRKKLKTMEEVMLQINKIDE